jgi:hypothetical protein
MCVAIHATAKGKLIPFDDFEMMRLTNGDGMGLMWAEDGKLHIIRQLRRLRRFWKRYKALHEAGKDVVIHFRMATHGDTTMRNVHPIHVNSRLALVHNGILDGFSIKDERSDTRQFVDTILKAMPNDWYKEDNAAWNTISLLTAGSKMIFMDSQGLVRIMHKDAGWPKEGNWFSSMSWKLSGAYGYYYNHYKNNGWNGHYGTEGRLQYPPGSSLNPDYDPYARTLPVATTAYAHWPSGDVVCKKCRDETLPNEPHYNFTTIWDSKDPIVCEVCDDVVNRDELEAEFKAQCAAELEDELRAEYGIGAMV